MGRDFGKELAEMERRGATAPNSAVDVEPLRRCGILRAAMEDLKMPPVLGPHGRGGRVGRPCPPPWRPS